MVYVWFIVVIACIVVYGQQNELNESSKAQLNLLYENDRYKISALETDSPDTRTWVASDDAKLRYIVIAPETPNKENKKNRYFTPWEENGGEANIGLGIAHCTSEASECIAVDSTVIMPVPQDVDFLQDMKTEEKHNNAEKIVEQILGQAKFLLEQSIPIGPISDRSIGFNKKTKSAYLLVYSSAENPKAGPLHAAPEVMDASGGVTDEEVSEKEVSEVSKLFPFIYSVGVIYCQLKCNNVDVCQQFMLQANDFLKVGNKTLQDYYSERLPGVDKIDVSAPAHFTQQCFGEEAPKRANDISSLMLRMAAMDAQSRPSIDEIQWTMKMFNTSDLPNDVHIENIWHLGKELDLQFDKIVEIAPNLYKVSNDERGTNMIMIEKRSDEEFNLLSTSLKTLKAPTLRIPPKSRMEIEGLAHLPCSPQFTHNSTCVVSDKYVATSAPDGMPMNEQLDPITAQNVMAQVTLSVAVSLKLEAPIRNLNWRMINKDDKYIRFMPHVLYESPVDIVETDEIKSYLSPEQWIQRAKLDMDNEKSNKEDATHNKKEGNLTDKNEATEEKKPKTKKFAERIKGYFRDGDEREAEEKEETDETDNSVVWIMGRMLCDIVCQTSNRDACNVIGDWSKRAAFNKVKKNKKLKKVLKQAIGTTPVEVNERESAETELREKCFTIEGDTDENIRIRIALFDAMKTMTTYEKRPTAVEVARMPTFAIESIIECINKNDIIETKLYSTSAVPYQPHENETLNYKIDNKYEIHGASTMHPNDSKKQVIMSEKNNIIDFCLVKIPESENKGNDQLLETNKDGQIAKTEEGEAKPSFLQVNVKNPVFPKKNAKQDTLLEFARSFISAIKLSVTLAKDARCMHTVFSVDCNVTYQDKPKRLKIYVNSEMAAREWAVLNKLNERIVHLEEDSLLKLKEGQCIDGISKPQKNGESDKVTSEPSVLFDKGKPYAIFPSKPNYQPLRKVLKMGNQRYFMITQLLVLREVLLCLDALHSINVAHAYLMSDTIWVDDNNAVYFGNIWSVSIENEAIVSKQKVHIIERELNLDQTPYMSPEGIMALHLHDFTSNTESVDQIDINAVNDRFSSLQSTESAFKRDAWGFGVMLRETLGLSVSEANNAAYDFSRTKIKETKSSAVKKLFSFGKTNKALHKIDYLIQQKYDKDAKEFPKPKAKPDSTAESTKKPGGSSEETENKAQKALIGMSKELLNIEANSRPSVKEVISEFQAAIDQCVALENITQIKSPKMSKLKLMSQKVKRKISIKKNGSKTAVAAAA
eukprot:GHVL01023758.1.p1 GENE.GHVL01023758.1~~GHVL01023758.1.p1  ORF type:complete len:1269 (-),score=253.84 GHVL01023758.1:671-4477(-)